MKEGFLGGTFDPPHLGHLILAQEALEQFSLEKVYFVPSRNPPHKERFTVTDLNHRLRMLELAIEGNSSFQLADLEPPGSLSYTVDLLERISSGNTKPCFIMGMDSLREMHSWKEPSRILELADVVAGTRLDAVSSSMGIDPELLDKVTLFDFPGVWISSSDIRRRVQEGRSIRYLVPDAVVSYILSGGLYGAEKSH
ncbi:MAG: nicotinate-nucleotide adenylyltransferase [Candidatus Sabulitectum sp.]|nr:nicotinate-nucleotide adenylyltransferase [Candidatus Sabulitectum sp.]